MNNLNEQLTDFLKKLLDHIQDKHKVAFTIKGQEMSSKEISDSRGVFPMFAYAAHKMHHQLFDGMPQKNDIDVKFFKNDDALFSYEAHFPSNKEIGTALWLHLLAHVTLENVKDYKLTKKVSFDRIINLWNLDFNNVPVIKNPNLLDSPE